jgi:tRNA threonylcarbamoyladenosine biosynthesis protein TsaE
MKTYYSFSSNETELFGEHLAKKLSQQPATSGKHALIFALQGDLGSGKTTFVKGFFRGLGIKSRIKSPTFIIMRRNRIRDKIFKNVFHIDAYRMRKPEDLFVIDFKTIASDPKNIILIEWPENAKGIIPRAAHRIEFHHGKKESERTIIVKK